MAVTIFTSCLQLDSVLMHRPTPGWWSSSHGTGHPTTERQSCDPGLVHSLFKFVFGCDTTDNFKIKIPSLPFLVTSSSPLLVFTFSPYLPLLFLLSSSLSSSSNIYSPPSLLLSLFSLVKSPDKIRIWWICKRDFTDLILHIFFFLLWFLLVQRTIVVLSLQEKHGSFRKSDIWKCPMMLWSWNSLLALSPVPGLVEGSLWEELVQRWRGGGSAFSSEISQQQHNLRKELSPPLSEWLTCRKAAAGTWMCSLQVQ